MNILAEYNNNFITDTYFVDYTKGYEQIYLYTWLLSTGTFGSH